MDLRGGVELEASCGARTSRAYAVRAAGHVGTGPGFCRRPPGDRPELIGEGKRPITAECRPDPICHGRLHRLGVDARPGVAVGHSAGNVRRPGCMRGQIRVGVGRGRSSEAPRLTARTRACGRRDPRGRRASRGRAGSGGSIHGPESRPSGRDQRPRPRRSSGSAGRTGRLRIGGPAVLRAGSTDQASRPARDELQLVCKESRPGVAWVDHDPRRRGRSDRIAVRPGRAGPVSPLAGRRRGAPRSIRPETVVESAVAGVRSHITGGGAAHSGCPRPRARQRSGDEPRRCPGSASVGADRNRLVG